MTMAVYKPCPSVEEYIMDDSVIDRAVHNSPPPLDDVGGDVDFMLDEKDPAASAFLPTSPEVRKAMPICRGVLDYFPLAIAEVAAVSYAATQQHHPDKEMHWDKNKSTDEADCIVRHLIERGKFDIDGQRHSAKVAWRALALLQRELEAVTSCPKEDL